MRRCLPRLRPSRRRRRRRRRGTRGAQLQPSQLQCRLAAQVTLSPAQPSGPRRSRVKWGACHRQVLVPVEETLLPARKSLLRREPQAQAAFSTFSRRSKKDTVLLYDFCIHVRTSVRETSLYQPTLRRRINKHTSLYMCVFWAPFIFGVFVFVHEGGLKTVKSVRLTYCVRKYNACNRVSRAKRATVLQKSRGFVCSLQNRI